MMPRHLVIAFLFIGSEVEVAVRSLDHEDCIARFADDAAGLRAFVDWLGAQDLIGGETMPHACAATTGALDDGFYGSAFLEFAHESSDNAFIWNADQLAGSANGETATARAMLDGCVDQHHLAALANP
jgi:hypothetical protein